MEQHVQQWVELHADEWPWAEYAERWCWYRLGRGKNPRRFTQALLPEQRREVERLVDRLLVI